MSKPTPIKYRECKFPGCETVVTGKGRVYCHDHSFRVHAVNVANAQAAYNAKKVKPPTPPRMCEVCGKVEVQKRSRYCGPCRRKRDQDAKNAYAKVRRELYKTGPVHIGFDVPTSKYREMTEEEKDIADVAKRKADNAISDSFDTRLYALPVNVQRAIRLRQLQGALI